MDLTGLQHDNRTTRAVQHVKIDHMQITTGDHVKHAMKVDALETAQLDVTYSAV